MCIRDRQWKISLTKGFIALSTYGYTRWEEFAQRLDRILAVFIETYHPSWFTRVGLRYVNAFRRAPLGLEDCLWKELITPGFLGLMGDEDAQEQAFMKNELTATVQMPGGAGMDWLELVVACRSRTDYAHGYDIVEGKIADDNVGETVSYVMQGIMRREDAIERLRFEQINNQIAFCTEASLYTLHFQNSYICGSVKP